jgi:NAD-dependent dihydropyrimidine dehydrogenase PreA subunit
MPHIITEPCLNTCDTACVEVCPSDCIHPRDESWNAGDDPEGMVLLINPDECIDCGACAPECPVEAIFEEDEVPEEWKSWIKVNYEHFGVEYDG